MKLLKKLETGRADTLEPVASSADTYSKQYLPRTYSSSSTASSSRPLSASSSRSDLQTSSSTSTDVLEKRRRIANILREADEEDADGRDDEDYSNGNYSKQQQLLDNNKRQPQSQSHPQHQPQPQHHIQQTIPTKREAFEKFKLQHPDYAPSLENNAVLKEKYAVAKEYSEIVNQSREKISMCPHNATNNIF